MTQPAFALTDLRAELDAHAEVGRVVRFWWRDDDAIRPTPALDRLLSLVTAKEAPLGLAVIPQSVEDSLAVRLVESSLVTVIQHGWSHANHAPASAKKCELGNDRPVEAVLGGLRRGYERLSALFPGHFHPVLVPPWNRIGGNVAARLSSIGLLGLSTHADQRFDPPGVVEANTHIDPVDWRGGGGLAASQEILARALARMRRDRQSEQPAPIAIGLLTHHLVMDDATWAFVGAVADVITNHPGAVWLEPRRLFAPSSGARLEPTPMESRP